MDAITSGPRPSLAASDAAAPQIDEGPAVQTPGLLSDKGKYDKSDSRSTDTKSANIPPLRMQVRIRTAIKRVLMRAYCNGNAPMLVVRIIFVLFRLCAL